MLSRKDFVTEVSRKLYESGNLSFFDKPFVLEKTPKGKEWLCRFGERMLVVTDHSTTQLVCDMAALIKREDW